PRRRPKCLLRCSIRKGTLDIAVVVPLMTSEVTRRPTEGHYDWDPSRGRARHTRGGRRTGTDGRGGHGYPGRHESADGAGGRGVAPPAGKRVAVALARLPAGHAARGAGRRGAA